jgi:hypothetical protein
MKKIIISSILFILSLTYPLNSQWTLSYSESGNCFTSIGQNLFLGTWFLGTLHSTDFGQSWITTGFPYPRHVISLSSNSYGVFAGTDSYGIYVSTNQGTPWTLRNSGLTQLYIQTIFCNGNIVFAGNTSGVFVSTDNGLSWAPRDAGLTSFNIYSFTSNPSYVFVGSAGGVCLSSNNGITWSVINTGLTNLNVDAMAANGNNIFAGTYGGGVFFSSNNGTNWTPVNNGLTHRFIRALIMSGNNVFAGADTGGVYFSSNNGQSWTAENDGLTIGDYFKSFLIDNNYIFASMDNSVYKRTLSEITGIHSPQNNIPDKYSLSQNYPNPFNPSTIINYQLPKSGEVKLTIYDAIGREVKILVNEKQNAGSYQVVFDGSNLPSGVYFYKLQAGDYIQTKKMGLIK